jgi:endonuclease/exonuclease/phosphatase family metal-dependent hydrolase
LQESLDFQLKEIKRALPGYKSVSASRDDGGRIGEACPILYRRDRFSLADSGTFWFSNTPWEAGSKHWGNEYPRICTWVRLTEISTNESFYVYNLHLDHQSQNSRQYSMNLLAKEIAKRKHPDPVIVMGDFNMDTDNPAMAAFRENGTLNRYIDVWQHLHPDQPGIKTYHAFGTQPTGPCLDHILIDETIEIMEVVIDARKFRERYPSDHFPVIAHLRVY